MSRDKQIERELQFHIERLTADNIAAGMSPEEARRQALVALGGVQQFKEECREVYRWNLLENLAQDLTYSFRALRKTPLFSLVAILILGIGIGANATVFSIVNTVLLRPLPLPDSGRIVHVRRRTESGSSYSFDMHDFAALKRMQQALATVAIQDLGAGGYNLQTGGTPEQISGIHVSAPYFDVFGVTPMLGRTFATGDDIPGRPRVAVISQGLWAARFGRDTSVIGRAVLIGGLDYTVVGVVPDLIRTVTPADIFLRLPIPDQSQDRTNGFQVYGRLKPGVTLAQAEASLDATARRFAKTSTITNMPFGIVLREFQQDLTNDARGGIEILFGAVAFVLLIACSNVANLVLARGAARRREVAVMSALGAGRSRIVLRLLAESALLAGAGGTLGVLLAHWGVRVLPTLSTYRLPEAERIGIDAWVLGFVILAAALSALLAGIAPAVQLSRVNLTEALRQSTAQGGAGRGANRLRNGLVISQIALSTVLLTGAILLVRSFSNAARVNPGYRADHLVTMKISIAESRYPDSARVGDYTLRVAKSMERCRELSPPARRPCFPRRATSIFL